jgi:hypothetical protein
MAATKRWRWRWWSGNNAVERKLHLRSESIAYLNIQNGMTNQNYEALDIYDDCDGSIGWGDVALLAKTG